MALTVEEIYDCPAERVWSAITSKDAMKSWYFDIPDFELKAGSVFNFFEPGGKNLYHHRCTILEIIPNQILRHTWTHPSHSQGESILTWFIQSVDDKTQLILTHEGIDQFKDGGPEFAEENYKAGWIEILGQALKGFVEKN